jgi:hypothetical protein
MGAWTPEYLAEKAGPRQVSTHVCDKDNMDFVTRNFK